MTPISASIFGSSGMYCPLVLMSTMGRLEEVNETACAAFIPGIISKTSPPVRNRFIQSFWIIQFNAKNRFFAVMQGKEYPVLKYSFILEKIFLKEPPFIQITIYESQTAVLCCFFYFFHRLHPNPASL